MDTEKITIHIKTGGPIKAKYIDGGGSFIGSNEYEVHAVGLDNQLLCIPQQDIVKVVDDETGKEVSYGNRFFPGHPQYKEEEREIIKKIADDYKKAN